MLTQQINQARKARKALRTVAVLIREWLADLTKRIKTEQKKKAERDHLAQKARDFLALEHDRVALIQQGWSQAIEPRLTQLIEQYGAPDVLALPVVQSLCTTAIQAGFQDECQAWQNRLIIRPDWSFKQSQKWMAQCSPHHTKTAQQHGLTVIKGGDAAVTPDAPPITVGEVWPDAPDAIQDQPLPLGSRWDVAGDGRIMRIASVDNMTGETTAIPVAYMPMLITGASVPLDVTTEESWVHLVWRNDLTWQDKWILRRAIMTLKNAPTTLNDLGIRTVNSETTAVIKWLEATEQVGRNVWQDQYLANTLGWKKIHGTWGFMLPDHWIGPALPGGNDRIVFWPKGRGGAGANFFQTQGTLQAESALLAEILTTFPTFAWLLGHSAAAPLLRRISSHHVSGNLNGYVVELASAKSSTGKTSLTALALMPWRTADIPIGHYASSFGLEQQLLETNDLPTAIQELQADKRSKVNWSTVVHMVAEKGGKIRGQKEGGYTTADTLHTVLLITNNQSILSMIDNQAGAAARILSLPHVIPADQLNDPAQGPRLKHLIEGWMARGAESYGNGGRQMLKAVAAMSDDTLLQAYKNAAESTRTLLDDQTFESPAVAKVMGRQAHAWAFGLMGLRFLLKHGYGWPEADLIQNDGRYLTTIRDLVIPRSTMNQVPEADYWWGTVSELIFQYRSEISGLEFRDDAGRIKVPSEYIGRYFPDDDLIGILPSWLRGKLDGLNHKDVSSLLEEWSQQGKLIHDPKQHTTKKRMVRTGGGPMASIWVYCFKASALGFGSDEYPEESPTSSEPDDDLPF